MSEEMKSNTL